MPLLPNNLVESVPPRMAVADEDGSREDDGEGEGDTWGGQEPPAEWRRRMHAARRRTMLVVVGLVRWQMAMARRPGPKRLPRVNSFSYYIPQVGRATVDVGRPLGPKPGLCMRCVHEVGLAARWKGKGERGEMLLPGCNVPNAFLGGKEPFLFALLWSGRCCGTRPHASSRRRSRYPGYNNNRCFKRHGWN